MQQEVTVFLVAGYDTSSTAHQTDVQFFCPLRTICWHSLSSWNVISETFLKAVHIFRSSKLIAGGIQLSFAKYRGVYINFNVDWNNVSRAESFVSRNKLHLVLWSH